MSSQFYHTYNNIILCRGILILSDGLYKLQCIFIHYKQLLLLLSFFSKLCDIHDCKYALHDSNVHTSM